MVWEVRRPFSFGAYNVSFKEARPTKKFSFQDLLEIALINIWGDGGTRLNGRRINQTSKAISEIRAIYRRKGERGNPQPSNINYKFNKNRAGYLAAFGERHAYLPYLQLRDVNQNRPDAIPLPHGKRNELVVTSLDSGACLELYGICLFYLNEFQQNLRIVLNSIEKEREWIPNRHIVCTRLLKGAFPKVNTDPDDITIDLREDAIPELAKHYDRLAKTDILLIYNIMNEIPTPYAKRVYRNFKFLLDIFQQPALILLMEPSANRAEPQIYWLKRILAEETNIINSKKDDTFYFDVEPICITSEPGSLNQRLFGRSNGPILGKSIQRSHTESLLLPHSAVSMEQVVVQLSKLEAKRTRKGTFLKRHQKVHTFADINKEWIN